MYYCGAPIIPWVIGALLVFTNYCSNVAGHRNDRRAVGAQKTPEELQQLVDGLVEGMKTLTQKVEDQNQILRRHEVELDNVSEMENKSLEILQDLTGRGPGDCSELYRAGVRESGIQVIFPSHSPPVKVYCDMRHDGGGWTVIQRRYDGKVSFNRGWVQYARGFGNPAGEHWLGLRTMNKLTTAHQMELYVALTDYKYGARYERYGYFHIGDDDVNFRLEVADPSGTAGDSLSFHSGHEFSTRDRDHDNHSDNCSRIRGGGGWWFHACHVSNLNGQYYRTDTINHNALTWYAVRHSFTALKGSVMLMRPVDFKTKI